MRHPREKRPRWLKPFFFWGLDAALKRRSSTVLLWFSSVVQLPFLPVLTRVRDACFHVAVVGLTRDIRRLRDRGRAALSGPRRVARRLWALAPVVVFLCGFSEKRGLKPGFLGGWTRR